MKTHILKPLAALLIGVQLLQCAAFAANTLTIYSDDALVSFAAEQPFIDTNNRTQVPASSVSDMLDCTVELDEANGIASIIYDDKKYEFAAEKIFFTCYNKKDDGGWAYEGVVFMDTESVIIDNVMYIPLRSFFENIGKTVEYNDGAVYIYTDEDEDASASASENPNSHGLYIDDLSAYDASQLSDEWYTADTVPADIAAKFETEQKYEFTAHTSDSESYDNDTVEEALNIDDTVYTQNFYFNGVESTTFCSSRFLKSSTGRIAVKITSDDITSDDLWIHIDMYGINHNDNGGRDGFFQEAWHSAFDNTAVVVFDNLDPDTEYRVWICAVNDEEAKTFSGNVQIVGV